MRKKIRFASVLCLIALIAISVTAYARYSYISTLSTGLSISASDIATASGRITPKQDDLKCTISVTIKKKNGSNWSTYAGPWTGSGTGYNGASASGTKTLDPGTYKAVAVGKVYDSKGNLLESDTVESSERSYS